MNINSIHLPGSESRTLKQKINYYDTDINNYKPIINENPLDIYDLVVQIESIKSLFNKGWNIKGTDYGKEKLNLYEHTGSVVVTAIRNKNKGKSFILNKISEKEIPRGFTVDTQGLSIIYPKKRPVIILDTCGSESPLLDLELEGDYNNYQLKINNDEKENNNYENKKKKIFDDIKKCLKKAEKNKMIIDPEKKPNYLKLKEKYFEEKFNFINKIKNEDLISQINNFINERKITDYFLQRFALEKSNVILLVIGKMTREDQFFLNKIKKNINNNSNLRFSQQLLVIHNLYNFKNIKDVKNYIEENLKKSDTFFVKQKQIKLIDDYMKNKKKKDYFKDYFIEENNFIHFIMAEEGTEAGDYYNDTVIEYIKCCVCVQNNLEKFDLLEQLKDFFYKINEQFISGKFERDNFEINKEKGKIKINSNRNFKLKDFSSNFLDFALGNTKFIPDYEPYIDEYNNYIILIECPGESKIVDTKVCFEDNYTSIQINGEKKLNYSGDPIGGNKLSSGTFNLNIKIPENKRESNIDDSKIKVVYTSEGYIKIIFKIIEDKIYN